MRHRRSTRLGRHTHQPRRQIPLRIKPPQRRRHPRFCHSRRRQSEKPSVRAYRPPSAQFHLLARRQLHPRSLSRRQPNRSLSSLEIDRHHHTATCFRTTSPRTRVLEILEIIQKKKPLESATSFGVLEGTRTLDPRNHNPML